MLARIIRTLAPLVACVALIGGLYGLSRLTVDPELRVRNAELGAELTRVRTRNTRLRARVDAMKAEITRLRQDPEESLYHARTGLGLVRSGEVVYRFPDSDPGGNDPGGNDPGGSEPGGPRGSHAPSHSPAAEPR